MQEKIIAMRDGTRYLWNGPAGFTTADLSALTKFHDRGTTKAVPKGWTKIPADSGLHLGSLMGSPADPAKEALSSVIAQGQNLLPRLPAPVNDRKGPMVFAPSAADKRITANAPFTRRDFDGLAFSYDSFMHALNAGGGVERVDGKWMPFDQAHRIMMQRTGKTGGRMTLTPGQVADQQDQEAYDANGQAGVGNTVGFSRGKRDAQVPRGQAAKQLYQLTHYKDGHWITKSERGRDLVNGLSKGISEKLQTVLPTPLADFATGIPMAGLENMAELQTMGDTEETPRNAGGAALNLGAAVLTDQAGRYLAKGLSSVTAKGIRAIRASGPVRRRVAAQWVNSAENEGANLAESAMKDAVSPNLLGRRTLGSERLRIKAESPNSLTNYTERSAVPNLQIKTDERLIKLRDQFQRRYQSSLDGGDVTRIAENEHNLNVIRDEFIRRRKIDPITKVPFGSFDPNGALEQKAVREAALNPVRTRADFDTLPRAQREIAKDAWFKKYANNPKAKIHVPALGTDVLVDGAAFDKSTKKDPIGLDLFPYLPQIIAKAKLAYHEGAKRGGKDGVMSAARLVARIESPEGPRDVWIVVRRKEGGMWFYDARHTEVYPALKDLEPYARVIAQGRLRRQGDGPPQRP